ncbi:MAG: L-threonylcarbamoyladenylate synthase [Treponema sp.]|jgi:tRNA threonylcarbamoyl adenosine modification protein (Sua5/YciO/YrdC/YwlC family)|nr:L-threonylcarbamoyladenylate synthase [Treponema sp.]
MIEYVVPANIDDRILTRAVRVLNAGGLLALPTDTSWSLACSLTSREGIKKLKSLSGERDERHFTLLCSDISQFGDLCSMDNTRFRLIKRLSPGPYVFILKTLLGTEKALDIRRREAGVRIPNHPVPLRLIKALGCPLYSITAKRSMAAGGERFPGEEDPAKFPEGEKNELPPIPEEDLFEGGWELEDIERVDLILDGGEDRERVFSTILDLSGDEARLLRQGAGPWPA